MAVSRTWCFTLNNWTEEDYLSLKNLSFSYLLIGKEVSSSGTPHLQGYVTLQKPSRLSALKKVNARAHWEVARSVEASKRYCKKDGDYKEFYSDQRKKKPLPSGPPPSRLQSVDPRILDFVFRDVSIDFTRL